MKFAFLCKERSGGGRGKVAVVGGGPAGLAATGYLVCQGYEVDVYEKQPIAGGMMMFAIPPYRVVREGLLEGLEDLEKNFSVKIFSKTKVFCGEKPRHDEGDAYVERVVDLKKIIDDYDAVILTTGTWRSRELGIPGSEVRGVYSALEYLYEWWVYEYKFSLHAPPVGRKIVVIGGGLSAIDAAEVSLMKGAHEVYLVYRRTIKEAPAGEYEVRRVMREGVKWVELAAPNRVVIENGALKGVEFVRMRLGEPDESGRPRPVPIPGSEFIIEADLVIAAIGELPTPPFEKQCDSISATKDGRIAVNARMQTANEKVFAAGDVVTGPSMIGRAFGSGLKAAQNVDMFLRSKKVS